MIFSARHKVIVKIAARNIWLNWRHSLATLLAIALGFAAVSIFDGFMANMRRFIVESYVSRSMMGHVLIQKKGAQKHLVENPWIYSLSKEEQNFTLGIISKDQRVAASARFLQMTGMISNGSGSFIFVGVGYDVEEGLKFRGGRWAWNTVAGQPLHLETSSSLLLGPGLAKKIDCQLDEKGGLAPDGGYIPVNRPFTCHAPMVQLSVTTEHSQINALEIKPVGSIDMLMREYNERFIFLPLPIAQKLLDTDRITRFSVLLKDPSTLVEFIKDFQRQAQMNNSDLEAFLWLDHPAAAAAKGGLEILGIFRSLFLTVVIVIAAMSIANSMMKSINERIRETGMLRSMGFRQSDIVLMFTTEGLGLGLLSCIIGLVLTVAIGWGISHSGVTFRTGLLSNAIPLKIDMNLSAWLLSILIITTITGGTSWLVSRRSAKMVVADSLRHVA